MVTRSNRHTLPVALRAGALAVIATISLAAPALAGEYRVGNSVTIGPDETIEDDVYAATGTVTVAGTVDGDLTVAGGNITVRGIVRGSLNVAGGTVDVSGEIGGAVRVMGGTTVISGIVGRDVVVVGGTVDIQPGANIGGDVAGGVGTLTVGGSVDGDLRVGAGVVDVTGQVAGELDLFVDDLIIGSGAEIGGDVAYTSANEARIAEGARIGGEVARRDPPQQPGGSVIADNPFIAYVGLLLGLLVLGWGLLAIRPRLVVGSGTVIQSRPLLTLGAGIASWIGQFVLVVALFIAAALVAILAGSLGGAFVIPALVVLLLVVVAMCLAGVPVAMAIGLVVLRPTDRSPYLAYAAGAAILAAVLLVAGLLIAALGLIVFVVVWIVGLGAFTLYAWNTRTTPYLIGPPSAPPPPPAEVTVAAPPPPGP